jgi:anti-sigma28 factor (negative regulator of flagellin synthesis)
MRIHGTSTPEVGQRGDDAAKPPAAPAASDVAAAEAAPVVVSTRAQEIAAGGQRDAAIHGGKLSALKEALERGSYKIDYDKLADRIVSDEIERARRK